MKNEKADYPIVVGEKWYFKPEDPIWPSKIPPVIIRDYQVEANIWWIRYSIGYTFSDERMREETFRSIYFHENDNSERKQ